MQKIITLPKVKWDNTTKAFLALFFSQLYFYLPILSLYYQQRGLNFAQINSLWAVIIGTKFLAEIPTGVVADKVSRKLSIVIGLALQLVGEVMIYFGSGYPTFIVISIIAGIGFAFGSGALEALIYDSLKEEGKENEMKKVMGSLGSGLALSTIVGAALSSIIVSHLSPERFSLAILLTICTVAVGVIFSLFLKEPKRFTHGTQNGYQHLIKDSFALIKNNKSLRRIVLLAMIVTPFGGYLQNLYPPYFVLSNVPAPWFGLALAIGGVLTFFGSKYAYLFEEKLGMKFGVLIATILPGILYLLMALVLNPILAVVIFCLNYGSMSLQGPLFSDYQNAHIPSENRATALSAISMFAGLYTAIMGPIIGVVADISVPLSFAFMGAIVIVGAVFMRIDESHLAKRL